MQTILLILILLLILIDIKEGIRTRQLEKKTLSAFRVICEKVIATEEDFRYLIREKIMPLVKKFKVNFSKKDLTNYKKEAIKVLSKDDLKNISCESISAKSLMALGLMAFMFSNGIGNSE